MELNGVANIQLILDLIKIDIEFTTLNDDALLQYINKMENQLDSLNRYMVAIANENPDAKIPAWHEIIANKDKYKKNGEP